MAKIRVKQGAEGPRHDPYAYTEVEFTKTDGTVVLCHMGLAEWIKVNGSRWITPDNPHNTEEMFRDLTGMTFSKALHIPYILEDRLMKKLPEKARIAYYNCVAADLALLRYAM